MYIFFPINDLIDLVEKKCLVNHIKKIMVEHEDLTS